MKLRSADRAEDASCVTICTLRCVLWDVVLWLWMTGSFFVDYMNLSMKVLRYFETS